MLEPKIRIYSLELKQPWAIASRLGKYGRGISTQCVCLLKLEDEQGRFGYGEAAPVNTYGETMLNVLSFLRQIDWSKISFDDLQGSLERIRTHKGKAQAARCAIDIALHDGASKLQGRSIHEVLGLSFDRFLNKPTAFSIGIGDTESLIQKVESASRFPILKMKVGTVGVNSVIEALQVTNCKKLIRIDGNEAWKTPSEALRNIEKLEASLNLEFIEQPMPRDASNEDMAWLKKRSPVPIIADESCRTEHDIENCLVGFHGINVKLSKAGGIAPAFAMLKTARSLELKTQLGCMIESSLGIAAALQLSSFADWLDLDGALLTRNDPFMGVTENEGQLTFENQHPGVGVYPTEDLWKEEAPGKRSISNRARVPSPHCEYGRSVHGIPLEAYLPSTGKTEILFFASIHGEESETTALLSKALRSLDRVPTKCAVVLNTNPDGTLLGTRGNANGVELNRNFPSANWQKEPVTTKWAPNYGQVSYSTGTGPASEPETKALIGLVKALSPIVVISLHAPLSCIDDPESSEIGNWISMRTGLPIVSNIGYPTPGSFGSWAKENGIHVITYELPPASVSALHTDHLAVLVKLLTHGLEAARPFALCSPRER